MKESAMPHKNFIRFSEVAGAMSGTYDSLPFSQQVREALDWTWKEMPTLPLYRSS